MDTIGTLRETGVRVAGVRSPVIEAGPPEAGEAAVFVHGNPGSSRDWEYLMQRVGSFGRAVAPDMPGFGQADKPKGFDYTVEGYARHLDGTLEGIGVRRAHLVLHDFGCPWGLSWAADHPEKVASVTLINHGFLPGYRWHLLAKVWRTPLLGELFMATITHAFFRLSMKPGNPRGLPAPFVDRLFDDFDRGTRRAVLKLYRATPAAKLGSREQAKALRMLPVPALVVWGKADPYVPLRYAEGQREVFPGARIVVLERSGHWPFADDPETVADEVVPFLWRNLGSSGEQHRDNDPPEPLEAR